MDLIETGRIVNTHGLRGEVKIEPWADSAEAFCAFERLFVDGAERRVERSRVQKRFVIAKLAGIDSIEDGEKLKNRIVYVPREDLELGEDKVLLSDLVGCRALDEEGRELGQVTGILTPPGGDVLEIEGEREILVPVNGGFLLDADVEAGTVTVRLIEGM